MRSAVRTTFHASVLAMGLSFASMGLAHPILHFDLDTVYSAGSATPQSTPVVSFANLSGGNGVLAMVTGMVGSEFLSRLAFNYDGSATPSFAYVSGAMVREIPAMGANPAIPGTRFEPDAINLGPVGAGGAGFDIVFDYSQAAATRFSGDNFNHSLYTITGAGIDESDFNVTNAAGFFAAAHIQGGAMGGGGAFVAAIPEAETYAMLIAGLGLLGFVMSRRRKSVAPAV